MRVVPPPPTWKSALLAAACFAAILAHAQTPQAAQPPASAPAIPPRTGTSETVRYTGASLADWEGNPQWWSASEEGFSAKSEGKIPTNFLFTKKSYSDFRLTLRSKVLVSTNHAGVCFWGERNVLPENPYAYKCILVIFPNLGLWDYFESKGIPISAAERELGKRVTSQNEWIDVEILAQSNRIRVAYNGVQVLDWREPHPDRLKAGPIALQLHGFSQPQQVIYRDVAIETFPKEDRLLSVKP